MIHDPADCGRRTLHSSQSAGGPLSVIACMGEYAVQTRIDTRRVKDVLQCIGQWCAKRHDELGSDSAGL